MKFVISILSAALLIVPGCTRSSSGDDPHIPAWAHPASLSDNISPDHADAYNPVVAMNDSGHIVVVWEQSDGSNDQIFKSEFRGAWVNPAGPTDNITPDSASAYSPALAMSDNNDIVIAWRQEYAGFWRIYKSEYRSGVWTHPLDLTFSISPDGSNASDPQVVMADNGDTVIAWMQWNGAHWQAYVSECRGGYWTHPLDLTGSISPDGQNIDDLGVAMNGDGNVIIVWNQSSGVQKQVFMSECQGGIWSHPADLNDSISPGGGETDDPAVVMNASGDAVIAWEQEVGTWKIYKSEYRSGVWTHPANTGENINPAGPNAWGIALDLSENGECVIAWEQNDGVNWRIFMSEYRSGTWIHPANLTHAISPSGSDVNGAALAMDGYGGTVIAWEQPSGGFNQIFKSEYGSGAWTHPADLTDSISPDDQNVHFSNLVAMDRVGTALIAWEQWDGSNWQVFLSERRGGAWSTPPTTQASISPDGQDVDDVRLVMNALGLAAIVWTQSDGNRQQVFRSYFR